MYSFDEVKDSDGNKFTGVVMKNDQDLIYQATKNGQKCL